MNPNDFGDPDLFYLAALWFWQLLCKPNDIPISMLTCAVSQFEYYYLNTNLFHFSLRVPPFFTACFDPPD